jgi:antitoxin (DNA-binding transcriptional repressor) of toxin-antitoxin stability system
MKATLPEPEIVTRKGKPVSVIIPIKDYEELLERVEDTDDVAWFKHARRQPLHYRPLEDCVAKLGIAEEDVLKKGMKEKSREFTEKGAEVYAKA